MSIVDSTAFGLAVTAISVALLVTAMVLAELDSRRRVLRWLAAGTGILVSGILLAAVAARFLAVLLR